jgi:hypothetical protein
MYDLGLTQFELRAAINRLRQPYVLRARVQLLDLDHNFVSNATDKVLEGQVSVNYEGEDATRALDLLLYDPEFDLGFDTGSITDGVWFFDRMVQVVAEWYVPELDRTIECPIFTGPITGFKRKRHTVTMSAAGKDLFAKKSWPRLTIKRDTNYVDVVRKILEEMGETKFRFTATTFSKLSADKVIDRNSELSPWGYCRLIVAPLGMRLYYDGAGYATLRNRDDVNPVFTFTTGDEGTVVTRPEVDADYSRLANVVRAESTDPQNTKAVWEEFVDVSSPIHPSKLSRGGKPLYLGVVVQQDSITTEGQAKTAARAELKDRQFAAYRVTFDALPMWMLEEADTISVQVENVHTTTMLQSFSLSLKPAVMPVGYNDLVAPVLAKIRNF